MCFHPPARVCLARHFHFHLYGSGSVLVLSFVFLSVSFTRAHCEDTVISCMHYNHYLCVTYHVLAIINLPLQSRIEVALHVFSHTTEGERGWYYCDLLHVRKPTLF